MIQDPDNSYIRAINGHVVLHEADILEIGCGSGRMTQDIARYAKKLIATDVDKESLMQAANNIGDNPVQLLHTPQGKAQLPSASLDIVIYTLSLHHVEERNMIDNLLHSSSLLKKNGKIVVIEPGDSGSFMTIKNEYNAGSGDESIEKAAALKAMRSLPGWDLALEYRFEVGFLFDDTDEFLRNKLPRYRDMSQSRIADLKLTLKSHTTADGILLTSERILYILERSIER